MNRIAATLFGLVAGVVLGGCGRGGQEPAAAQPGAAAAQRAYARLSRTDFNRRAAELNLPLFWRSDANDNQALDTDELVALWGVAGGGRLADYVADGRFTAAFDAAYARLAARGGPPAGLPPAEAKRRQAVLDELAQGRPTLVETDLRAASASDRALVENILAAADVIERLYAKQKGTAGFQERIPADDPASRMLAYRNQGPFCVAPRTEGNPDCSALAERPRKISGLYPAAIQSGTDTRFCSALEKRPDADELLGPFTVVVAKAGGQATGDPATDELAAVPYNVAYRADMEEVSARLMAAAAAITDPQEAPLQLYLAAAAESFLSNDWQPADEAWARMNAGNSRWYLRVAPDEVDGEPCSRKALFQLQFARINPDGLEWQRRLAPRRQALEAALAALAGPAYAARAVEFHLPDFIDVALNAGDARLPLGALIGEALPNFGPVAAEGRGRTVAMVNLYSDADSIAAWTSAAASLFCARTMDQAAFEPRLAVMTTVLHEAAHNLGPAAEFRVNGRTAEQIFGGAMAGILEELKAQTAALYLGDWLAEEGVLDRDEVDHAHRLDVAWAFGHIAAGMYDADGKPRPYSQLASIQLGTFLRDGALAWRAEQPAANRTDKGCFDVDAARLRDSVTRLATRVLRIKATGDTQDAEALRAGLVDARDDWAKAREVIRERYLRGPKASFVYAIER